LCFDTPRKQTKKKINEILILQKNCYTNYVPAFGVDFKTSKNLQIVKKKNEQKNKKLRPPLLLENTRIVNNTICTVYKN